MPRDDRPAAPPRLHRRALLAAAPATVLFAGCANAAEAKTFTVHKTPWCGCCGGWVQHMVQAGWTPTVIEVEDLTPVRAERGVPAALSSCHTAVFGRYVVEGHVPAADVERLLRDRPNALGIAVPGMPLGSPGMESASPEPYETLLLLRDGGTRVFARHG